MASRAKPKFIAVVFMFASLFQQVTPGPMNQFRGESQCMVQCRDNDQFHYDIGQTYEYDYALNTLTSVLDTLEQSSEIKLDAKVLLTPTSQCQLSMQLRNIRIDDGSTSDQLDLASKLEKHPLTFSYQNGVIEEVCPAATEDNTVLNIKRGIMSTLQNSMKNIDEEVTASETDVLGVCDTHYSAATGWGTKSITKTKDLLSCTKRHNQFSSLHSMGYTVDSGVQHLPIIQSSYKCEQKVRDSLVVEAICEETHVLKPFSGQDSAPQTKSTQTITFQQARSADQVLGANAITMTDLLYDHQSSTSDMEAQEALALNILSELVKETEDEVNPKVTPKFSHLIYTIRGLNYQQLKNIHNQIYSLHREQQFFLDALPVAASGGAISMMYDIFTSGVLSEVKQDLWLTSLGFTAQPTLDMIGAASEFLNGVPRKQALLGVSAMVHRYCSNNEDCIQSDEVRDVVVKLENLIGTSCGLSYSIDENLMVVILKALGNIGRVVKSAESLQSCAMETQNSMTIRLAAIDAYRRMPCETVSRDFFMPVFKNADLDSEIRIGAYLAVMKCPTSYTIMEIKNELESMPVNQVGSFVWTHLTNLQESDDPFKQEIRESLGADFLKNKFNTDARKFSRNFEGSLFWNEINAGATWDSNLIFSTKSYLPRSLNLNLTVNLFGEAFNLFEVGGRAEGFEQYIESIFGSDGLYPEEHVEAVLKGIHQKPEHKETTLEKLGLRETPEEQPEAAAYLRMFGSDILYEDFKGANSVFDLLNNFNPMELFSDAGSNIDYTKSFEFLNAEFNVPLASGLPLTISLNGMSMVRLQAQGKFNVGYLFNDNIEMDGHIKPSAVIEVSSLFSVDLGNSRSGLQSVSSMHTSSYVDGSLTMKGGKLITAKLNTPRDRVEFLTLDSKVYKFNKGQKEPLVAEVDTPIKVCSGELMGSKLCSEFLYNPLNVHTAIYLEKTDKIDYYLFNYELKNFDNMYSMSIVADTPNSETDRRMSLTYTLDTQRGTLECNLYTPSVTFDVNGNVQSTAEKAYVNLDVLYNKDQILSVDGALTKTEKSGVTQYEPKLVISAGSTKFVSLRGSMDMNENGKSEVDLSLETAFTEEPATIKGTLNLVGQKTKVDLALKTPIFTTSVNGMIGAQKAKLTTTYSIMNAPEQALKFNGKYFKTIKGQFAQMTAAVELAHTAYPEYALMTSLDTQLSTGHVENQLKIKFGSMEFEGNQLYSFKKTANGHDITAHVQMKCPEHGIDYFAEYVHKSNEGAFSDHMTAYVDPSFPAVFRSEFVTLSSKYSADAKFTYPGYDYQFTALAQQLSAALSEAKIQLSWAPELSAALSGTYSKSDSNHQVIVQASHADCTPASLTVSVSRALDEITIDAEKDSKHIIVAGGYHHDSVESSAHGKLLLDTEHSAKFAWRHDGQINRVEADIKTYRQIQFNAEMRGTAGAEASLLWDAARDLSQKVTFSATNNRGLMTAELTYPERTIALKIQHQLPNDATISFQWADDKTISLQYLVKETKDGRMKFHSELTTPFGGFYKQSADIVVHCGDYTHRVQVNIKMDEGRKSFTTKFFAGTEPSADNLSYKATLKVDSNNLSEYLQDIEVALDAKQDKGKYSAQGVASWMSKKVKVEVSHIDASTPSLVEYESFIDITTPISDRLFTMLRFQDDGSHFFTKVDTTYGQISNAFETSGTYKYTRNTQSMNIDAKITSAYIDDVIAKFNFAKEYRNLDVDTSLQYSGYKQVAVKVNGNMKNKDSLKGEVSLQVFQHEFSGKLDHMTTETENGVIISSTLEGNIDGKKASLSMNGKLESSYLSRDIETSISLSTPWPEVDGWKLSVNHSKKSDRYVTDIKVSKHSETSTFSHNLSVHDAGNWDNTVYFNDAWGYVETIDVTSTQKFKNNEFSHITKGSLGIHKLSTSAYYNYNKYNLQGKRSIEAKGKFVAPFTPAMSVEFMHEDDGINYEPKFTVEYAPEKKIYLEGKFNIGTYNGENSFKVVMPSKYSTTVGMKYSMKSEKEITLFVRDSNDKQGTFIYTFSQQGGDSKLDVSLSSSEFKEVTLQLINSLSKAKYSSEVSLGYNDQIYKLGGKVTPKINGDSVLYFQSPDKSFKVNSMYNFDDSKKVMTVEVTRSNDNIVSGKFEINPSEEVSAELKTEYESLQHVTLKALYKDQGALKAEVAFQAFQHEFEGKVDHVSSQTENEIAVSSTLEGSFDGKKSSVSMQGKLALKDLEASLRTSSTWEKLDAWVLSVKHAMKSGHYETQIEVSKSGVTSSFSHTLILNDAGNWENKIHITSPWEQLRAFEVTCNQKWSNNKFSHVTKGTWNEKELSTSTYYNYNMVRGRRSIEAKSNIMIPFGYAFNAEFEHQDDGINYSPKVSLEYAPDQKISVNVNANFGSKIGDGSIEVTLPFQKSRNTVSYSTKLGVRYEAGENEADVTVFVRDSNDKHITFTYTTLTDAAGKMIQSRLSSSEFNDVTFKIINLSSNSKYAGEISLDYNEKANKAGFEITSELKGNANVYMQTNNRSFRVTSMYNFVDNKKQLNIEVTKNHDSIVSSKLEIDPSQKVSVELKSKYESLSHISAVAQYDAAAPRKVGSVTGKWNDKEVTVTGVVALDVRGEASIEIQTPFQRFTSAGIKTTWKLEGHKNVMASLYKEDAKIELTAFSKVYRSKGTVGANLKSTFPIDNSLSHSIAVSYKKSQTSLEYDMEIINYIKSNGAMKLAEKSGTLNVALVVGGNMEYKVDGEFNFNHPKKIAKIQGEFDGSIVNINLEGEIKPLSGNFKIDAKTPLDVAGFVAEYNLENREKSIKIEMTRNSDRIELNAVAEGSAHTGEVKFTFLSTLYDFQEMSVAGKYETDGEISKATLKHTKNYESLFDMELKAQVFSMLKGESSLKINFQDAKKFNLSGYVNFEEADKIISATLLNGVSTHKVEFKTNLEGQNKNIELTTTTNGVSEMYKAELTIGDDNISAHLSSPFEDYRDISVGVHYKQEPRKTVGSISFSKNYQVTDISFSKENDDVSSSRNLDVKLPMYPRFNGKVHSRKGRSVSISVEKDSEALFSGNVNYDGKTKNMELRTTIDGESQLYNGDLTIEDNHIAAHVSSPFEGFRDMGVDARYEHNPRKTSGLFSFTRNNEVSNIEFNKEHDADVTSGSLNVITPWFPQMTGKVNSRKGSIFSVDLESDSESLFSGNLNMAEQEKMLAATMRNGNSLYNVELKGNLEGKTKNMEVRATVDGSTQTYKGDLTVGDNKISAHVSSPFENFEEMSVETQFKYKPKKTSGSFSFARNNEAGEISFNTRNGKDKISGNVDVKTPWYPKISATVNSRKARSVAVELQKDSETLFSGDINLADSGKELSATLRNSNTLYNLELKGNLEGQTKYLEISTKHDETTKTYRGDLTLGDSQMRAHVSSPFAGYEDITVEGNYNLADLEKMISASLSNGNTFYNVALKGNLEGQNKNIELSTTLDGTTQTYKGDLTHGDNFISAHVSSPFEDFKQIAVETSYEQNNGKTSGKLSLSRNNEVSDISFNKQSDGDLTSGNIDVTTPWYPKVSAKVHSRKARSVSVELQKDSETLLAGDINLADSGKQLSATVRNSDSLYNVELKGNVEGNNKYLEIVTKHDATTQTYRGDLTLGDSQMRAHVSSPFEGYEDITVEGNYNLADLEKMVSASLSNGNTFYNVALKGNLEGNKKNIELSTTLDGTTQTYKGDLTHGDNFISAHVSSPFEDYKQIGMEAGFEQSHGKTSGKISLSRNNEVSDISFNKQTSGDLTSGNLDLTTPWYPKMSAKVNSRKARSVEVELERDTEIVFSGDVKLAESGKELSAGVRNGNSQYNVQLKGNFEGKNKYLEVVTMLDGTTKTYKGDLTVESNKIASHISSPFAEYRDIAVEANYNIADLEKMVSASMRNGNTLYSVEMKGTLEGNNKNIELRTTFDGTTQTYKGDLTKGDNFVSAHISSPFEDYKKIGIDSHYEQTKGKTSGKISLSRNNDVSDIAFNKQDDGDLSTGSFAVNTPGYPSMTGEVKARKGRSISVKLEKDSDSVFKLKVAVPKLTTMKGKVMLDIETPFSGFEKIFTEQSYDFLQPQKSIKISYNLNGVANSIALKGRVSGTEFSGVVKTTFPGYEQLKVSGTMEMDYYKQDMHLLFEKSDYKAEMMYKGEYSAWKSSYQVTLNSPNFTYRDMRKYDFTVPRSYFVMEQNVNGMERKLGFEVDKALSGNAVMQCQYPALGDYKLTVTYNLAGSSKTISIETYSPEGQRGILSPSYYPGGRHQFTGEFTELQDGLEIKLTTPFNIFQTAQAKYTLKQNIHDYEGVVEAAINHNKIYSTITGKGKYGDNNKVNGYTVNAEISLPIENFEKTGLDFAYTFESGVSGQMNLYSGQHRINTSFRLQQSRDNLIDFSLEGTNTVFSHPSFSIALVTTTNSVKVNYTFDNKQGSAVATYSGTVFNGEASVKFDTLWYKKDLQVRSQISEDYKSLDLFVKYGTHTLHLDINAQLNGHVEVSATFMPSVTLRWQAVYSKVKGTFDVELKVDNESYGAFGGYYENNKKVGFVFSSPKFNIAQQKGEISMIRKYSTIKQKYTLKAAFENDSLSYNLLSNVKKGEKRGLVDMKFKGPHGNIKLDSSYNFENGFQVSTTSSLDDITINANMKIVDDKVSVNVDTPWTENIKAEGSVNFEEHTLDMFVKYGVEKLANLNAYWLSQKNEGKIRVDLPGMSFKFVELYGHCVPEMVATVYVKTAEGEYRWTGERKLGHNFYEYQWLISTPHQTFDRLVLHVKYHANQLLHVTFEYPTAQKLELALGYTHGKSFNLTFKTPFQSLLSFALKGHGAYNKEQQTFSWGLHGEWNGEVAKLSMEGDVGSPQYSFKVSAGVPLKPYNDMHMSFKYNTQEKEFNFLSNIEQHEFHLEGKASAVQKNGVISLKSESTNKMLNSEYELKYNFEGKDHEITASGKIDRKTVTLIVSHEKETLNSLVELQTPFEAFNGFAVSTFSHQDQDEHKFQLKHKCFSTSNEVLVTLDGRPAQYSLTVDTTYPEYKNIQFVFALAEEMHITAEFGEKKLEAVASYKMAYPNYEVKATVATPFAGLKQFSLDSTVNMDKKFKMFTSMDFNNENKLFVKSEVEGSSLKVDIKTPLKPFEHISLDGKLDYSATTNDMAHYNLKGTGKWGSKKTTLTGKFIHEKHGLKFNLDVAPEMSGYDKASVNVAVGTGESGNEFNVDINTQIPQLPDFTAKIQTTIADRNVHMMVLAGTENVSNQLEWKIKFHDDHIAVKVLSTLPSVNLDKVVFNGDLFYGTVNGYAVKFNVNDEIYENTVKYELGNSALSTLFCLHIPFLSAEDISTTIKINYLNNYEVTWEVNLPNKKYLINTGYTNTAGKVTCYLKEEVSNDLDVQLSMDTTSPMAEFNLKLSTWNINHSISGKTQFSKNSVHVEANIECPNHDVAWVFNVERTEKSLGLQAGLSLPNQKYTIATSFAVENGKVTLMHKDEGIFNIEVNTVLIVKRGDTSVDMKVKGTTAHRITVRTRYGDIKSVQVDVNTPLIGAPYTFTATVSSKKLEIKSTGVNVYSFKASYGMDDQGYSGKFEVSMPNYRKTAGTFTLSPSAGSISINIANQLHKFTYQILESENKLGVSLTLQTPFIGKDKLKVVLKYKNKDNSHQVRVTVNHGDDQHSLLFYTTLSNGEKKIVTKLDTPLYNIRKLVMNSAISYNAGMTEGSMSLETPEQTHSISASSNGVAQGIVKINSPLFSEKPIKITYTIAQTSAEFLAEHGAERVRVVSFYSISNDFDMQGSINIETPYKSFSYLKVDGAFVTTNGLKVNLNVDSDNKYLSDISVDGKYLKSNEEIVASFTVKTPVEHYKEMNFDMSLDASSPLQHVIFSTPNTKYAVITTADSLTGVWDNKQIKITFDSLKIKPDVNVQVAIETPFSGYEQIKLQTSTKGNDMKVSVSLNEKLFEVSQSIALEEVTMINYKITTPFPEFNRLGLSFSMSGEEMEAALELPAGRSTLTANYAFNGPEDINVSAEVHSIFMNPAKAELVHKLAANEYSGCVKLTYGGIDFVKVKAGGALEANSASFKVESRFMDYEWNVNAAAENNQDSIYGKLNLASPFINIVQGEINVKFVSSANNYEYSVKVNDQSTTFVDVSFILDEERLTLTTLNPIFPLSLTAKYTNDKRGLAVEGEFCWNLEDPMSNTVAASLILRKNELKLKVHHPKTLVEIYGLYRITKNSLKHKITCTIGGYEPAGYEIKLRRQNSESENKYFVEGKILSPHDAYSFSGESNFHPMLEHFTVKLGYHQKDFDFTTVVSSTSNETKVKAMSSVFPKDLIYSIQYKFNEDNTLFYVKEFVQPPVNHLGSFTHELDISEEHVADGKKYVVVLKGEGSSMYDGEVTLTAVYQPTLISADLKVDAYNFFENKFTGHYVAKYEDSGITKKVTLASPNQFLLEGTYQPLEDGFKTGLKGTRNNTEVVNSSLVVDNNPGFVHFSAGPRQDNQLINVRGDMSDLLSAKLYVQPQIVNYIYQLAY